MESKGRALKRRQAGGKRLFQKHRKRFKSSNNDIQSTEVVPQTLNKAVSSSSKKLNPIQKKHFSLHRIQMKSVSIMRLPMNDYQNVLC